MFPANSLPIVGKENLGNRGEPATSWLANGRVTTNADSPSFKELFITVHVLVMQNELKAGIIFFGSIPMERTNYILYISDIPVGDIYMLQLPGISDRASWRFLGIL